MATSSVCSPCLRSSEQVLVLTSVFVGSVRFDPMRATFVWTRKRLEDRLSWNLHLKISDFLYKTVERLHHEKLWNPLKIIDFSSRKFQDGPGTRPLEAQRKLAQCGSNRTDPTKTLVITRTSSEKRKQGEQTAKVAICASSSKITQCYST